MKIKRHVFVLVIGVSIFPALNAFADASGCQSVLKKIEATERDGKLKDAYDAAMKSPCYQEGSPVVGDFEALLKRTAKKLGEAAEKKGQYDEASEYYRTYRFGVDEDRVQYRKAMAKPDVFSIVQGGVAYLRGVQQELNDPHSMAGMGPDRNARMKAIPEYLDKLQTIALKNGNRYLSDDDRTFKARNTSLTAKSDSLSELGKARDWLGLFGQGKLANERALQHGDALATKDTRTLLRLAIDYYQFADNEPKVDKVKEKARRLGDASLKKGDNFYAIAGMDDKSRQLEESYEKEKEKAENKRQGQFKNDQDSLEKELGM